MKRFNLYLGDDVEARLRQRHAETYHVHQLTFPKWLTRRLTRWAFRGEPKPRNTAQQ